MEKLRTFLNSMQLSEQEHFAKSCGTSIGYLRKAISIGSKFDGSLCRLISKNSDGQVSLTDLRPDIFEGLIEDRAA